MTRDELAAIRIDPVDTLVMYERLRQRGDHDYEWYAGLWQWLDRQCAEGVSE